MHYLFSLIFPLILNTQVQANPQIEVTITNIDTSRSGNLMVFIFNDDNFPIKHEKALAIKTVKVESTVQKVIFELDEYPEELAFKVLHDEDMNNKTTKNWTGIWPKEGLGFSNNQKLGTFGPPSFKDSKMKTADYLNGVSLTIRYP